MRRVIAHMDKAVSAVACVRKCTRKKIWMRLAHTNVGRVEVEIKQMAYTNLRQVGVTVGQCAYLIAVFQGSNLVTSAIKQHHRIRGRAADYLSGLHPRWLRTILIVHCPWMVGVWCIAIKGCAG